MPQLTVVAAVYKIYDQAKTHPEEKPDPCRPWQGYHEIETDSYAPCTHYRIPWHPKLPWNIGLRAAKNKNADSDKDEGK